VAEAGFADVHVVGTDGPAWTIDSAAGDDADAPFDSALRCAQLTENVAEIVDASAHLMALATAPDWPSDVQMIAEDDPITSTLLPAAPTAPPVMGEPPTGRHVVFCGVKTFHHRRQDHRALATRTVT